MHGENSTYLTVLFEDQISYVYTAFRIVPYIISTTYQEMYLTIGHNFVKMHCLNSHASGM